MQRSTLARVGIVLMLAPLLAACSDPRYVENGGTRYYDANDMSVDTMERTPFTKNGVYYTNPTEATNTRDNRGMLVPGYNHNTDDDFPAPPVRTMTTYNADGTVTVVQTPANGTVVVPAGRATTTTTTVVSPAPGYGY